MSDEEVEVVFENVERNSHSSVNNKKNAICRSRKIPRITDEQATKIKSETSQYLKEQIRNLKRKSAKHPEHKRQIELIRLDDQIKSKWRKVKYVNGITKTKKIHQKDIFVPNVSPVANALTKETNEFDEVQISTCAQQAERDNLYVHNVSPAAPQINCQENESKGETPVSELVQQAEENISVVQSISSTTPTKFNGQSNEFTGKAQVSVLPHETKEKSYIVHSVSPVTPTKINGNTNESQGKLPLSTSPSFTQQNIRLSGQVSKRPKKFSINGSPVSSSRNSNLHSKVRKTSKSVHHTSPLTFMRNKFDGTPEARDVKRKLNFSNNSFALGSTQGCNSFSFDENPLDDGTELDTGISRTFSYYHNDVYLVRQLRLHVDTVLADSNYEPLINDEERDIIHLFFSMDSECRDLYVRMHNRNYKWNRLSDIKYNSATTETYTILGENGFLLTDMQNLEVDILLDLLKFPEIKGLCKSLGIKCSSMNKKNCSEEIKLYCQKQKSIDSKGQIVSSEKIVMERIKNILGPCFILSPEPRSLFRRIHLLFNLKFNRNEQSRYGSQDLFEIQFVGTEKALYPKYIVDKTAKIFNSRDELLRFQTAEDLKMDYFSVVDAKDLIKAEEILRKVRVNFRKLIYASDLDESSWISACELPLPLRKFTLGTSYAYILYEGIDVLKKLKKKDQAINDLLVLLDQDTYLPYMRGRLYEKLMTIYRSSGQLKEVANTICIGMQDPQLDDQSSYVISSRCRELLKRKKGVTPEVKSMLQTIPLLPPLECVEPTEIKASALDGKAGYKRVYVQDDVTGDGKIYSSVEELARSHYCPRYFERGIHAENSLVSSLFGVLFWDVIYEYHVPCAFLSEYQSKPLDLSTGEFYKNRQDVIDAKLLEMSKWTATDIASYIKKIYDEQSGKSSLVHWKWFQKSELMVDIINCIGLEMVLRMCERYAKKYRDVRSGFPDLFLWTPGQNKYKFVEVKGPNDKLSPNQKLWLDFLVKNKANVEVCFVKAQGSKTTKITTALEPSSSNSDVQEKRETVDQSGSYMHTTAL